MSLITIATDGFTIFNAFIFTSPLRNRGGRLSLFYNCVTAMQRGKAICPKSRKKSMESRALPLPSALPVPQPPAPSLLLFHVYGYTNTASEHQALTYRGSGLLKDKIYLHTMALGKSHSDLWDLCVKSQRFTRLQRLFQKNLLPGQGCFPNPFSTALSALRIQILG